MAKLGGLTPAKRLYLEYWTAHREHLEQRNGVIKRYLHWIRRTLLGKMKSPVDWN